MIEAFRGGKFVTVAAELHQLPIFVRVGSDIELGDLNQQFQESLAIAQNKPDLKKLDAEVGSTTILTLTRPPRRDAARRERRW